MVLRIMHVFLRCITVIEVVLTDALLFSMLIFLNAEAYF